MSVILPPAERLTGNGLHTRYLLVTLGISCLGIALVGPYLIALLQLMPDQWRFLGKIAALFMLVAVTGQIWLDRAIWRKIGDWLDHTEPGEPELEAAFSVVVDLPRHALVSNASWWAGGGLALAAAMVLRFDGLQLFTVGVLFSTAACCGLVTSVLIALLVKRMLQTPRDALAERIPDSRVREGVIQPLTLRSKLVISLTAVTLVPVVFALLLAQVRATRLTEAFAVDAQRQALGNAPLAHGDGDAREKALRLALARLSPPSDLVVLDPRGGQVLSGAANLLLPSELAAIAGSRGNRGDSRGFDSPNAFSWIRRPQDRIFVAVAPGARPFEAGALGWVFVTLLVVATAIPFAVARLLSSEIARAIAVLEREAECVASGDLRRRRTLESEDEFGALARSFQRMSDGLRVTVGRVSQAADRVDSAAGELSVIGANVDEACAAQVAAITQASSPMQDINSQIHGVAGSARALALAVEESSSSILELGAVGEQLNGTSAALSEQVAGVSGSIEQIIRSVREVAGSTEASSVAATETSSGVEEMASSMREVDANAAETARLSSRVIAAAERGREKVMQSAEGMEAIREATETADRVIRDLGVRVQEIGAIVSVIDDVADDTNLLALHAAIIAAQAGEHGRSFSVVADEIKELAERVLTSTKEIAGLIRAVQDESGNAVRAIEGGMKSVKRGVHLSGEAAISLVEITRAAHTSGERIAEIVSAVREQAKAATHVADLMERVRVGVDQIRTASQEQAHGNDVVLRNSIAMRDVAQQVRSTSQEQARGSTRIRVSIENIREVVDQIDASLRDQSSACREAVDLLAQASQRTQVNEHAARQLREAMQVLRGQAESLRGDVAQFRIE